MLFIAMLLMCASIGMLSYVLVPILVTGAGDLNKQRSQQFLHKMDRVLQEDDVQKAYRLYLVAPIGLSIVGLIFSPPEFRFGGVIFGVVLGAVLPNVWISYLIFKLFLTRFN